MKNIQYYGSDFKFHYGNVEFQDGKITRIEPRSDEAPKGCDVLIPGLIDVHLHGAGGGDFSDGDAAGLEKMARYLAKIGVTSFAPASLTLPEEVLRTAYENGARFHRNQPEGTAALRGIHMEGPFFSEKKKGAQNPAHLRLPDVEMINRLDQASEGLLRIVDVAPELSGAIPFISAISKTHRVSVAHTDASYDEAKAAFEAGAVHVTHLYNAMPPLHHRDPGVIAAAAEQESVMAELICDGNHVHPATVRATFRLFGAERICMISDALSACGMPEGPYVLGGLNVVMKDHLVRLTDGTIAGAATNLFECLQNVIAFGIPVEDAVRCATWNPACCIGAQGEVGSISVGKTADLLLLGSDYSLKQVYLAGTAL